MLRVAEAVHRTDTGRQRDANEDSYFARAPVFAVADGMGGARAGEVASRIAVEAFEPERDSAMPPERYLSVTAQRANREIFDLAQGDRARSGMGTTLTAALVGRDEVSFGHVGDSRAYRYRDGELTQLTADHSLVEELRRQGKLTEDQAADHPQRSVITRALGPEPHVQVDTMTVRARDGDVFVLCSDGLTTMLPDGELAALLADSEDLDSAARGLVRAANERGGRDNITVVIFRVESVDSALRAAEEEPTLVGKAAEEAGFTAEAVRETAAADRAKAPVASQAGSRRRRVLAALAALAAAVAIVLGAAYGSRQVWFLGTDEGGRVSLFRGLPYELPLGVELYSEVYSSPIKLDALPEDRRGAATDHELRSRDDAVSLIEDLRRAADQQAAAEEAASERPDRKGGNDGKGGSKR